MKNIMGKSSPMFGYELANGNA